MRGEVKALSLEEVLKNLQNFKHAYRFSEKCTFLNLTRTSRRHIHKEQQRPGFSGDAAEYRALGGMGILRV